MVGVLDALSAPQAVVVATTGARRSPGIAPCFGPTAFPPSPV
jgi:hypothetical protein